jgi:hypothetical protein
MSTTLKLKDPDAKIDFKFDLKGVTNGSAGAKEDYLVTGETISTYVLTVDAGIVLETHSKSDADTSVTVWLSGGSSTAGTKYNVHLRFTTSAGRIDDQTMIIEMIQR